MTIPYAPTSCTLQILALLDHHEATQEFRDWQASTPDWRKQIQAHHLGLWQQEQGPESLRHLFRKVRNSITVLVEDWPNIPYQDRQQTEGKIWVTKAEWDSLKPTSTNPYGYGRAGRAGKNPKTSKALVTFWHVTLEKDVTLAAYVV